MEADALEITSSDRVTAEHMEGDHMVFRIGISRRFSLQLLFQSFDGSNPSPDYKNILIIIIFEKRSLMFVKSFGKPGRLTDRREPSNSIFSVNSARQIFPVLRLSGTPCQDRLQLYSADITGLARRQFGGRQFCIRRRGKSSSGTTLGSTRRVRGRRRLESLDDLLFQGPVDPSGG